jgi:hypothetical protein
MLMNGPGPSTLVAEAQEVDAKSTEKQKQVPHVKEEFSLANLTVDVKPVARDEEIRQRLESVLKATEWFTGSEVRVEHGVVFLSGETETDELKKWASDLAGKTQDVVAVANRMTVTSPSIWDFRSTWSGLIMLWRDFIRSLPAFAVGLLIIVSSVGAGLLAIRGNEQKSLHEPPQSCASVLRNWLAWRPLKWASSLVRPVVRCCLVLTYSTTTRRMPNVFLPQSIFRHRPAKQKSTVLQLVCFLAFSRGTSPTTSLPDSLHPI